MLISVFIMFMHFFFFFFQAEDGIRDVAVTGVQTCALPISKMSVMLGLTAEQQQPVRDILFARIESRTQVSTAGLGGDLSPEETKSELAKILKDRKSVV